jgi:hypothetical protein
MKGRGKSGGTSTAVVRPRPIPKKTVCKLGIKCPYKDEYQHQLEFTHELSTKETSSASSSEFVPFNGKGRKLGHGEPEGIQKRNRPSNDDKAAILLEKDAGIARKEDLLVKSAIQQSLRSKDEVDFEMELAIRESLRSQHSSTSTSQRIVNVLPDRSNSGAAAVFADQNPAKNNLSIYPPFIPASQNRSGAHCREVVDLT